MMKSIVTAAALLTLGIGSAFAGQGQSSADHGTWFYRRSDQYAHPPKYTGPAPVNSADNGTWFYRRSDQYAHPPKYTGPAPVRNADNGTWFYLRRDQYAHPPSYTGPVGRVQVSSVDHAK